MTQSHVTGIYIAEIAGEPLQSVDSVRAVPGRGLEGDRYFKSAGTFTKPGKLDQQVTLIESEALEALEREDGIRLEPVAARRNIATRGLALNHLVNREFNVGDVRIKGLRLCEPCGHLEKLTQSGVKNGLIHRGGLRAQILSEGVIRVGDRIDLDAVPRRAAVADVRV